MLIVFHVYIFVLYALYLGTLQERAREMKVGNLLDTAHNIHKMKLTVAIINETSDASKYLNFHIFEQHDQQEFVGIIILSVDQDTKNFFFIL